FPLLPGVRQAGTELVDEAGRPVLLVPEAQRRRDGVALIPLERLLRGGLVLVANVARACEGAIGVRRGPGRVAVGVVELAGETVAVPLDQRGLDAARGGVVPVH